jgi:hypothetical protein
MGKHLYFRDSLWGKRNVPEEGANILVNETALMYESTKYGYST